VYALAALLLGCAAGPDNRLVSGEPGAPGVQKFLVCAPNTVVSLPAELEAGPGPLRAEIDAYLKHHGREVKWLSLYDAKQLLSEALARAKQQGDVDAAMSLFAAELHESYPYDALVMPSIVLHETRITDNRGRWDGVARTMRQVNEPELPTGGWRSTFAEGVRYGGISGEAPVTSLHVLVFTSEGKRVFEGRGGIEFIQEIDLSEAKSRNLWRSRMRDDLFENADALREAIEVAFDPYLPRPAAP
jgi:hypothetical protein